MSRAIITQNVTLGGTSGNDIDGHLEILEQQELPSSTFSIGTTVLSEACCGDVSTIEALLSCWPSRNIGCSSIARSVFSAIFFFVVVLILLSRLLPFNKQQHSPC